MYLYITPLLHLWRNPTCIQILSYLQGAQKKLYFVQAVLYHFPCLCSTGLPLIVKKLSAKINLLFTCTVMTILQTINMRGKWCSRLGNTFFLEHPVQNLWLPHILQNKTKHKTFWKYRRHTFNRGSKTHNPSGEKANHSNQLSLQIA